MSQLRLRGTLSRQAELRITPASTQRAARAVLRLEFNAGQGLPLLAWFDLGLALELKPADDDLACSLKRGTEVAVLCGGLVPQTDHGNAYLRLVDVERVAPITNAAANAPTHPAP